MQSPEARRNSALGYIAAFTLGILSASCLFFVLRTDRQQRIGRDVSDFPARSESVHIQPIRSQRSSPLPSSFSARRVPQLDSTAESTEAFGAKGENSDEAVAPLPMPSVSAAVAGASTRRAGYIAGNPQSALKGKVILQGLPPPEKALPLDAACAAQHKGPVTTRFFAVGRGGELADVLVFVSSGLPERKWPMPQQAHVIQNRGCVYDPYISAARAGQLIRIVNLGPILHNVHVTPNHSDNPELNRAQMPGAPVIEFSLPVPELFVRIKCDVHPWEFHYFSLFDHPFFAVSDEKGEFVIRGLPEGLYGLEAHHRKSGVLKQQIDTRHGSPEVKFKFTVPAELQARAQ